MAQNTQKNTFFPLFKKIVKEYLLKKGVSSSQIKTKWISDNQQVAPNTSEENRLKNRRVEFVLEE